MDDSSNSQEANIFEQYLDNQSLIQKKQVKTYTFRTSDSSVYEYSIHLYNDGKRDMSVEKLRKKMIHMMFERALASKRNLVGLDFARAPQAPFKYRLHVQAQIVQASNFDAESICVKYQLQLPESHMVLENGNPSGTSPFATVTRPSLWSSATEASIGYCFDCSVLGKRGMRTFGPIFY